VSEIKCIDELQLEEKKVFLRVDFNLPLDDHGTITDEGRLLAALPTIRHAVKAGACVVLASHLGRPKGKVVPSMSLLPVGEALSKHLNQDVLFGDDCVGDGVRRMVKELRPGQVVLLENLRFHPGETKNDRGFARQLATGMDVWVMDAFGTAHRAHASTAQMAEFVKERAAGFLVKRELDFLGQALNTPARPFVAILGGSKVSDKIKIIDALLGRCDTLLIGGAMAYTFLKAQGVSVGESRVEADCISEASRLLKRAQERGVAMLLPSDHLVVGALEDTRAATTEGEAVPAGRLAVDIGPRTLDVFRAHVEAAGTVFWNGPVGIFERPEFARGTMGLARAVASSKAVSVIGGGDSAAAVHLAGVQDQVTHVSTGGGASLAFLEGGEMPGLAALAE